jgi:prephenate dehydratase
VQIEPSRRPAAAAVVPAAAGDEHEVRVAERAVRDDARAAARGHVLARLDGHERRGQAGAGEDLERPERVELVEAVEQEDLDRHAPIVAAREGTDEWQE